IPSTAATGELEIGDKKYQIEFIDEPLADDLKSAQIRLKNLGYDCGPVDGIWGPRSKAAMTLFQVNLSLPPTGEADEKSLQKLKSEHDLKDQTPAESIPKAGEEIPEEAKGEEGSFDGKPE